VLGSGKVKERIEGDDRIKRGGRKQLGHDVAQDEADVGKALARLLDLHARDIDARDRGVACKRCCHRKAPTAPNVEHRRVWW